MTIRSAKRYVLVLVALTGLALGTWMTSMGVYATPDSASYVGRAQQLREGAGPSLPFRPDGEHVTAHDVASGTTDFQSSHFPPLYSAALSLGPISGSARLIDIVCLAANLTLIVGLVGRLSDWHPLALLLAALLALADAHFVMGHTAALSEPLAMTLSLAALLVLDEAFRRARPVPWVAGFTVLAALAVLTRYAAVSVLIAGAIAILLHRPWSLRSRVLTAAALGLGAVPTLAWMAVGAGGARSLAFHGLRAFQGQAMGQAAIDWLAPRSLPSGTRDLLAAVVASTLAAAWYLARRQRAEDEVSAVAVGTSGLRRLLWIYLGAQVAVQVGTLLLLDVQVENRLLVPVHVLFVVAVTSLAGTRGVTIHRLTPRLAAAAVGVIVLAQFSSVVPTMTHSATQGPYAGTQSLGADPRTPALVAALRGVPADALIVSNSPDRLYLLTGRHSVSTPSRWSPTTSHRNPTYEHELSAEGDALSRRGGVVVIFPGASETRPWLSTAEELTSGWHLHALPGPGFVTILGAGTGRSTRPTHG